MTNTFSAPLDDAMMGQNDLSGHTDCCGSKGKRFHIGTKRRLGGQLEYKVRLAYGITTMSFLGFHYQDLNFNARPYKCVYLLFTAAALIHPSVI